MRHENLIFDDDPVLRFLAHLRAEHAGDRQFATTLARGMELLRCFTPEEPVLGNRAAWAVLAAARIYGGIGRKVRGLEEEGLAQRVSTTKAEKARAVALAFSDALVRKQRWPMPMRSAALGEMRSWTG